MSANANLWPRPPIDYTSRDFEGLRDSMIQSIPFFTQEWTDYNPSDFGIVMLELLAYMGDNLHFYIDRMAGEAFLPTALTRRSVINLLKLIDYRLQGRVAAEADLVFTLPQTFPTDFTIPDGTLCSTICDRQGSQTGDRNNSIYFETNRPLVIPSGTLEGTVDATEGRTFGRAPDYVVLGQSAGIPNQVYPIPDTPIIEGTVRVFVDEGAGSAEWQVLDTLVDSGPFDKVCFLTYDENGVVSVNFGDNSQGRIPEAGAVVFTQYRVGGGIIGNVGAGTITEVESTVLYNGSPVSLNVTNPEEATGGKDEQSIDNARVVGPRALRALYRGVTLDDFGALTLLEENVLHENTTIQRWQNCNQTSDISVSVFAVPSTGGTLTFDEKQNIVEALDEKKMAGTAVEVFDPKYQPVDIVATVFVDRSFDIAEVETRVQALSDAYFNIQTSPYTGFGGGVYLSDYSAIIDNADGVDHVDFDTFTRQPTADKRIWTGDADFDPSSWVIDIEAPDEEWRLTFTSNIAFSVRGVVSGLQGNGTLDTVFVSNNEWVTFLLSSGTTPMAPQDVAVFRTSPRVQTVKLEPDEFFTEGNVTLNFQYVTQQERFGCVRRS